jgi:molecular chaperone DnaK (HSP70)
LHLLHEDSSESSIFGYSITSAILKFFFVKINIQYLFPFIFHGICGSIVIGSDHSQLSILFQIKFYCQNKWIDFKYKFSFIPFIAFLFLFISNNVQSQQNYRRHFLIAYDVSSPFINAEKKCPPYRQALVNLFSNKEVSGFNEAYQNNLQVEKGNRVVFFDPQRDEISFYHFNIASSEISYLRSSIIKKDENVIFEQYNKTFLKNKNLNWSTYSSIGMKTPINYVISALSIEPTPQNFGSGVSMSNFVYPLILDNIDTTHFAEEYILIILSDFLTGSLLGNTKDLERVKDIYQVPYNASLPFNSPVSVIKRGIDYLASQYYKIDFFQYSFIPSAGRPSIGIISYKVKPKIGVLTPEDVSLFVSGDLSLNQRGYQSSLFRTCETKIKFTHNDNLFPSELRLIIFMPSENKEKVIFDDAIATKDETGIWKSKYTNDNELMYFDSSQLTYFIPSLKISLDSIINKKNFDNLQFKYEFKTKYIVSNAQPVNYLYSTERELPIENINYSTKATIIIMYYLLPILAILLLILWLAIYGKPRRLSFWFDGYLDSFEVIDYKTIGKLLTPYKAWNSEEQSVDHIIINGRLGFKSSGFLFNWNSAIYLKLNDISVPEGFELFLKLDPEHQQEFSKDFIMELKKGKKNSFSFVVGIRQFDFTKQVLNPKLIKFSVDAAIKDSFLFIKSELRENIPYNFHIGPNLGDVWVGFDPGTSGSCVAVGSATDNIILGEDRANKSIIPSILVFEKAENYHPNGVELPERIYKHGTVAQTLYPTTSRYKGFQSIKKLIGFKDVKEILFDNKEILRLKGKDLAGLLVKGLYKDISTYFNRPELNSDDYKRNGKFSPLRAVIAIPNNCTISKIQDMIDCIGYLKQFKEIRYVYEAEAVLFYYLSNFSQLNKGEKAMESETILVFDMGGATINATIVTANKTFINNRQKYDINFLGKIGYGIGGDTIDYCIIRFLLSFKDEFPQLGSINIFDKKIQLAELAFQIKKEIIYNYYSKKEYLITADNLQRFINGADLGVRIAINDETSVMYKYFLNENGRFNLFGHQLFIKTIFNNVKDAVNEVIDLSDLSQIDKVIFSGRSTAFPMIKETVEKQLKSKKIEPKIIVLDLEESKTAVAKGACWYGINKNAVRLNNLKTNAAFGFKKTMSANRTDVRFYELVEMGCSFDTTNDGIDSFQGVENINDDFAFDGGKVNFYQIMGKDADTILSEGQKHKFSKIASINLDQVTSKVAMKVNENDEVECAVILNTNRKIIESGVVSDQEIDEANEEHYTWTVK